MAKAKRPKTASHIGYGIMSPYGDMWTSEVFSTPDQALFHLRTFWRNIDAGDDLKKFKIVRAKQVAHYVGET